MRRRSVLRAAAVLTGILLPLLGAAPAVALDDGEVPAHTPVTTELLLFVAVPVGAFVVISALVVLPSLLRRPRYRPGRRWTYDPLWFAGPDDPDTALASARPGATARGGASADW